MLQSCKTESLDQMTPGEIGLINFAFNQKIQYSNEESQPSASNLKTKRFIYPKVQEEPMCLKISKINSLPENQTENFDFDLKTMIQIKKCKNISNLNAGKEINSKKSQGTVISSKTKKQLLLNHSKNRKIVHILPAPSKLKETPFQCSTDKNSIGVTYLTNSFKQNESKTNQSIIISEKPSVSYERNHFINTTFSNRKENSISQHNSTYRKISPKNLLLNFTKDKFLLEKSKITDKKSEKLHQSQLFLRIPERELRKSQVAINKIDAYFKKPQPVIKKSAATIKKIEINKETKGKTSEYQIKCKATEEKSGHLTNNFNNLRNIVQEVYLKRLHSNSPRCLESPFKLLEPIQNAELSLQILKPIQNSESRLQNQEPFTDTPELPFQNLESPEKKFKLSLNCPHEKEINKDFLQSVKILPDLEDGWDDSVKERLNLENKLPTDITKIAMQDLPKSNDIETRQSVPENCNYKDLSCKVFMDLDSYSMTSKMQSLDGKNLYPQEMNLENSYYQTLSNQDSECNYLNVDDLIFESNQPLISPVDLNENVWMNPDVNPIYTELLPVFYH